MLQTFYIIVGSHSDAESKFIAGNLYKKTYSIKSYGLYQSYEIGTAYII